MALPSVTNGAGSVAATGTDQSVTLAQQNLETSLNKFSVYQMQQVEKQGLRQCQQTVINANTEMMNTAKDAAGKVRL